MLRSGENTGVWRLCGRRPVGEEGGEKREAPCVGEDRWEKREARMGCRGAVKKKKTELLLIFTMNKHGNKLFFGVQERLLEV